MQYVQFDNDNSFGTLLEQGGVLATSRNPSASPNSERVYKFPMPCMISLDLHSSSSHLSSHQLSTRLRKLPIFPVSHQKTKQPALGCRKQKRNLLKSIKENLTLEPTAITIIHPFMVVKMWRSNELLAVGPLFWTLEGFAHHLAYQCHWPKVFLAAILRPNSRQCLLVSLILIFSF